MQSRSLRPRAGVVVLVVLMAAIVFVLLRPYAVVDWFRLRGYSAPAAVAVVAGKASMTGAAQHLFYINHPQLLDKPAFRSSCPQFDEQTIVIGCYLSGERGINLLSVSDSRLDGVETVTAAHEMLHAAYERLSTGDKAHVDRLLQDYYNHGLTDDRIRATLASYKKSEPGQQLNEMHSIFGTEIVDLPSGLENYYSRYFNNRHLVTAAAAKYQAAFTSRQQQIKDYDSQLATMGQTIHDNTSKLDAQGATIEKERQRLDRLKSSGDIDSYNQGVEPFNAQVATYNTLLQTTRGLIDRYNTIVSQRNAIAAQTIQLQQAINSSDLPHSQ